jgi:hypothetical protein
MFYVEGSKTVAELGQEAEGAGVEVSPTDTN